MAKAVSYHYLNFGCNSNMLSLPQRIRVFPELIYIITENMKSDFSGRDLGYLKTFLCLIIPTLLYIPVMPRDELRATESRKLGSPVIKSVNFSQSA
jgi:hypothetical protein